MKKTALIINYISQALLLVALLFMTTTFMHTSKLAILLVASYVLFLMTHNIRNDKSMKEYNYLYIACIFVFSLYASGFKGDLYFNIVVEFLAAALIGVFISTLYVEKKHRKPRSISKVKIQPPKKPGKKVDKIATKKTTAKKVIKKTTKKTVKKVVKKTTAKKTAKEVTKKNIKPVTKKAVKKVTKKSETKKTSKKDVKKTAKKVIKKTTKKTVKN